MRFWHSLARLVQLFVVFGALAFGAPSALAGPSGSRDSALRPGASVLVPRSDGTISRGRIVGMQAAGTAHVEVRKNGAKAFKSVDARSLAPLSAARGPSESFGAKVAGRLPRLGYARRNASGAESFNSGDGPFRTTPMLGHSSYKGEHDARTTKWVDPVTRRPSVVRYLRTSAERAPYKLSVRNGLIVDAKGRPFDTVRSAALPSEKNEAIFVMSSSGEIFASSENEPGKFHHSSLAGGERVAAAGTIRVEQGRLVGISNASGHYQPGGWQTEQALTSLELQGVRARGAFVRDVQKQTQTISAVAMLALGAT